MNFPIWYETIQKTNNAWHGEFDLFKKCSSLAICNRLDVWNIPMSSIDIKSNIIHFLRSINWKFLNNTDYEIEYYLNIIHPQNVMFYLCAIWFWGRMSDFVTKHNSAPAPMQCAVFTRRQWSYRLFYLKTNIVLYFRVEMMVERQRMRGGSGEGGRECGPKTESISRLPAIQSFDMYRVAVFD